MGISLIFILTAVFLFLALRFSLFFPKVSGIPVLMFHKVSESSSDFLTIPVRDFELQLEWIKSKGFQSISMVQFLELVRGRISRQELPHHPILITFDDGYADNVSRALPVLKRLDLQACLFVTTSYIEARERGQDLQYLSVEELRQWQSAGMEIGLHSHLHPNYRKISGAEVVADLEANRKKLTEWNLKFHEALAYPFGARPKAAQELRELKKQLKAAGLKAAFRIGNRIHSWKEFARGIDPYDVCRIDVRGDDPFFEFKIKVMKGRSKRF